jgi:hypothetical protein
MATPLDERYEKVPGSPLPKGYVPFGGVPVQVEDGDSWVSIARAYSYSDPWNLIEYNFLTRDPREINHYLREHVGCDVATPDRKNWRFTSSARPGVIYVPATRRLVDPRRNLLLDVWVGVGAIASAQAIYGFGTAIVVFTNLGAWLGGSVFPLRMKVDLDGPTGAYSALVGQIGVVILGLPTADVGKLNGMKLARHNLKIHETEKGISAAFRVCKEKLKRICEDRELNALSRHRAAAQTFREFGLPTTAPRPTVHVYVNGVVAGDLRRTGKTTLM